MKTISLFITLLLLLFSTTSFAEVPAEALTYTGCYQTTKLNGRSVAAVKENAGYLKWDSTEWTIDVESGKLLPIFEFSFFTKKANRTSYSQGGRLYFLTAEGDVRRFGSRNEQYKFTVHLDLVSLGENLVQAHYVRTMDEPTPEMPSANDLFILKKVICRSR